MALNATGRITSMSNDSGKNNELELDLHTLDTITLRLKINSSLLPVAGHAR